MFIYQIFISRPRSSYKWFCFYTSKKQSSSKFVCSQEQFIKQKNSWKNEFVSEKYKFPQETLVKTTIDNYVKKITVSFVNESYFLYDKSNVIEQTFITEIDKLITVYGSISYFNEKGVNEVAQIILFNNPLKSFVSNDTIKIL